MERTRYSRQYWENIQGKFTVILGADVSRHTIFGRLTSAATFHPGCQGWLVIAIIRIIMIIMMISPSSTLSPWSLVIANMPTKVTLKVWAPYLCQVQLQVQAAPAPGAPSTEEKLPRIAIWIFHIVDILKASQPNKLKSLRSSTHYKLIGLFDGWMI